MRIYNVDPLHIKKQRGLAEHLCTGELIRFEEEGKPYRIMARNDDFIIAMKPFNPRKTFLYTIVNLNEGIRGPDNHWCGFNYDDPIECMEALEELSSGRYGVSHRRRALLNIKE